ncbi:MAG: hypothetical protein R3F48_06370 [Candidatus Zixiibacteriota bacterium]
MKNTGKSKSFKQARLMLWIVAVGLFLSGITIWPAAAELNILLNSIWGNAPVTGGLHGFLVQARDGIIATAGQYPFLLYTGDWLAFAHIVLAILFVGAARDPVRNKWIVQFGLICCALVPVLAAVCIPMRGIPWFWFWIDFAFAPLAAAPLWIALRGIRRIESAQ